ncbi:NUDIX domain-containing protein [Nonomuraea dietziae]|uniref:NUDIX hydrolase n=1 Tax=Nonomuraea dietziae TaxID=65515 RepID=UPI0031E10351
MTGTIDKIAWIHVADGKILSTRSRGKDVYYIPGGKREPGETDLDTLTREIDEELAITILPATARHIGTYQAQAHGHTDGVTVRMTCYTAEYHGNTHTQRRDRGTHLAVLHRPRARVPCRPDHLRPPAPERTALLTPLPVRLPALDAADAARTACAWIDRAIRMADR